ncbi:hypothetical protein R1sor_003254 [Riccia sorocarpa]|uniref:Proline dehydrogenase n=1 Tax=Riccia sorocarpa TaxID=122646 RepID=A0ABD3H123_9MARC
MFLNLWKFLEKAVSSNAATMFDWVFVAVQCLLQLVNAWSGCGSRFPNVYRFLQPRFSVSLFSLSLSSWVSPSHKVEDLKLVSCRIVRISGNFKGLMAWQHYRALSSRLVKSFRSREVSDIQDTTKIWRRNHFLDGNLNSRSTSILGSTKASTTGEPDRCVVEGKKEQHCKIFEGYEHKLGLNSGGVVKVAPESVTSLNYGGTRFVHDSLIAGVADAPERATTSFPSSHRVEVHNHGEDDILQMEDGGSLYSGMKTKELLATLLNLDMVSFEPMVDLSMKVLTSPLMKSRILSAPIFWTVKRTAYAHFCAGENSAEAALTLNRMWELGLRGILDYSLEDAEDSKTCDENTAGFLSTIQQTQSLPEGSVIFACVKISAICPISLLERMSDLLRWQHKNPKFKLPWKEDGLPVLAADSPTYQTKGAPDGLSLEEDRELQSAQERLRRLCEACAARKLSLLVDAEYSTIQPAIDYMTYAALFEFNKGVGAGASPVVYNTLQTYLKDAPSRLALASAEATRRNAALAFKMVRGAYITREKALAASVGAPSPIHDTIQDTHKCYNSSVSFMLERISAKDSAALMLATHNSDSGKSAAKKILELGLDKRDPRIHFAQLKGMSDRLSLALARGGFNVNKYLPFGPVPHVIPYLVRRAEENRGLFGNTRIDRQSLREELLRRGSVALGLKQGSVTADGKQIV